jgi:molybdopterin-guanine dinucleotide biosynthesis protein A
MAKTRVFISHISSETALAQALKQHLQRDFLGLLDIFVSSDQSTIGAGSRWLDEVDKALKAADAQIVLASKESVGRPWVNFEAGAVWLRGIPVIPLCHSGMAPEELPVPLSMLQSISVGDPAGLRKLYDVLAQRAKVDAPAVDFQALAAQLKALETTPAPAAAVERIVEPRILCASSAQYAQPAYGFEYDIAAIESAFPGRSLIDRALTLKRLRTLLTEQRFDIVHLALPVHPRNGELIFSQVDTQTNLPLDAAAESMPLSAFVSLLGESQTRLVVIATCRVPLVVAQEVQKVAHMAASDDDITGEQAKAWAECFYDLLARGRSVRKAFALTRSQVDVPMRTFEARLDVAFAVPRT